MEKYNKFMENIAQLIEKGFFTSKEIKREIEKNIKITAENVVNRLNLVSREEFEVQKKIIQRLSKEIKNIKSKKFYNKVKKSKKVKRP
tara:strand:- start:3983 stop:4246 length:264 start_codon:yes stop_codon:yes gene_type:complete